MSILDLFFPKEEKRDRWPKLKNGKPRSRNPKSGRIRAKNSSAGKKRK